MNSVALTDHGRAGGLLQFKKACEKHKVKSIYGFEAYCAPEARTIKEKLDNHKKTSYHLTLLAKNAEGLQNIFQLTSIGWLEGFYYRPRIDLEVLEKYKEGLVVLSGCGMSRLSQFLLEDRQDEAIAHIHHLRNIFKDDFYLEVQNHNLDWQAPLKECLFTLSNGLDTPIVATQDSHYQERSDADLHSAICKLSAGDLQFDGDESFFKSEDEMKEMFLPTEQHAISRTQEVADKCNCEWKYGKTIWPVYQTEGNHTPASELRAKAEAGFKKIFGTGSEKYNKRLEYELEIINRMGFDTYFLVVTDFIAWAKANNIPVGPGRGSSCGSLACYCVGITNVDPIKYGLYFERFLNSTRVSNPDIDLDFCPKGRKKVMQYVFDKYGAEKCAQIGTFTKFKPRSSLKDFTRVLDLPPGVGIELAGLVPPDVAGKALTFDEVIEAEPKILKTSYSNIVNLARRAEKLVSQAGIHAAGVIISNSNLSKTVPLFRGKHNEAATQFDMRDVEEIGLIKYDFLGLKNITVIKETVRLVKQYQGIDIDIDKIDQEDPKVFSDIFQQGRLDGVFQFETSSGFRDLCIQVKPRSIEDLADITSLFRPGPLGIKTDGSTMVGRYVSGRNGGAVEYLIPELEPILNTTYGVMAFQEQIMKICTDVAGYTLAEADNMRKIIGKKLPDKMKLEREKFVSGCVTNKIDEMKATQLFDDIEGFAKYSFPKAHSVAYSIISYQTAWLKTHFKEEFYCALLNNSIGDQDDCVKYIHAAREDEIPILPPDINTSNIEFTLSEGTIVFGLAGIKGIGIKGCEGIIQNKSKDGFSSLEEVVDAKINKGIIKALAMCGALEEITDLSREQLIEHIDAIHAYYQKKTRWDERLARISVREGEIARWNENPDGPKPRRLPSPKEEKKPVLPDVGEASNITIKDKLSLERQALGFYLTGHPMDSHPGLSMIAKYSITDIKEGKASDRTEVSMPAVISSCIEKRTRTKENMGILKIEDKEGRIEATIFPRQWSKLRNKVQEDTVNMIHGTVKVIQADDSESPPITRIIVNDIIPVETDSTLLEMKPIRLVLKDGTEIEFTPTTEQNYSAWQQAVAFVNNIQRMG